MPSNSATGHRASGFVRTEPEGRLVEDPAELRIFGQGGLAEDFAAEHPGALEAVANFVSAIADHGAIGFLLGPIVLARARPERAARVSGPKRLMLHEWDPWVIP